MSMTDPHHPAERQEGMSTNAILGIMLGIVLAIGGVAYYLKGDQTTTASNSTEISTTGQGNRARTRIVPSDEPTAPIKPAPSPQP